MAFEKNVLKIPYEERRWIEPRVRMKLFKEIYEGYPKLYDVKLFYAALNTNSDLLLDYCIIFKARNDDDTCNIVLFDCPPIHSSRATPGYRYMRRTNREEEFFDNGISNMGLMTEGRFFNYITSILQLSLKKEDDLYWKSPKNAVTLIEGLHDNSLYQRRIH